jgi:hypothetical protein
MQISKNKKINKNTRTSCLECRMAERFQNGELERIWKDMVHDLIEVYDGFYLEGLRNNFRAVVFCPYSTII